MNKLFGYDGILTKASLVINTFVLTNILTLICCIPIFTIGAAFAAHQKVMQDFVMGNHPAILKTYFTAFWQNLGKATLLMLLFVVTAVFLALDFYFVMLYTSGAVALVLYLVLLIVFTLILGITACCLSLIVRYENTLGEHLRNCLYLMMSNLPRFVLMAALTAFPIVLFLVNPNLFIQLVPVWVFFGVSLLVYLQAKLMLPLFETMDSTKEVATIE